MKITFRSAKLQNLCSSDKELSRKFGKKIAKGIQKKLIFMDSASCLEDVPAAPPFNRHLLEGNKKGEFAVDAVNRSEPIRIVFVPDYNDPPRKEDGGYDLKKIEAVQIIEVGDYHK